MDKKNISISYIDDGKTFDWGKTSEDYAKYRDIYPEEFRVGVSFTRESWHGRMRACRGVGASMSSVEFKTGEMREKIAKDKFGNWQSTTIMEWRNGIK